MGYSKPVKEWHQTFFLVCTTFKSIWFHLLWGMFWPQGLEVVSHTYFSTAVHLGCLTIKFWRQNIRSRHHTHLFRVKVSYLAKLFLVQSLDTSLGYRIQHQTQTFSGQLCANTCRTIGCLLCLILTETSQNQILCLTNKWSEGLDICNVKGQILTSNLNVCYQTHVFFFEPFHPGLFVSWPSIGFQLRNATYGFTSCCINHSRLKKCNFLNKNSTYVTKEKANFTFLK